VTRQQVLGIVLMVVGEFTPILVSALGNVLDVQSEPGVLPGPVFVLSMLTLIIGAGLFATGGPEQPIECPAETEASGGG